MLAHGVYWKINFIGDHATWVKCGPGPQRWSAFYPLTVRRSASPHFTNGLFGIVDGTNKRQVVSMDDIVSWCKTGLQELNSLAQDCRRCKLITSQEMDTNERWF